MCLKVWMWMHQRYGRNQIVRKLYPVKTNNCYPLAVPEDDRSNQQKKECEWWSKMWVHQKNRMGQNMWKLYSVKTKKCTYLAVSDIVWLDQLKNECDWRSMNAKSSKLWNESNCTKIVFDWEGKYARTSLIPKMVNWI